MRPAFPGKMRKIPHTACAASWPRIFRPNLSAFVGPDVKRKQSAPHPFVRANEHLDGFGGRYRSRQVHGGVQNSGSLAGLEGSVWRVGKQTSETSRFPRPHI